MATAAQPLTDHPGAWKSGDLGAKDDFAVDLTAGEVAALETALAEVKARGLGIDGITRESFPLPALSQTLAALRDEIMWGRGLVLVRGFPVARHSVDDIGLMYFGFGAHLGDAMSQSVLGDRLGHVVDVGGKNPRERAYRNSRELMPHTDACDIIGMLSLVTAKDGGLSGYCSSLALYNAVVERHPEYLDVLMRGFPYHQFGEHKPGEPPVSPFDIPVFSWCEGVLSCQYLRAYMEMGVEELGRVLSEHERRALDLIDELSCSDEFLIEFPLAPGEATFINNYTVLHARTGFDDPRRHLLRLWLIAHDNDRPLAAELRRYDHRGGIAGQGGRAPYYTGGTIFPDYRRPKSKEAAS